MTQAASGICYEFSGFRLDPLQRTLVTIAGDRAVPVTAKVFDALLLFLEHRGALLDKGSLMEALWPNVIVEYNNLNQIISALRKALGDTPSDHRFIVTVPGRGYRFVAHTIVRPASQDMPPMAARDMPDVPAQPNQVGGRGSIAVLPFENMTGDATKDYMSDGLAEELIAALARVQGLRVPARTSSFAYKGRNVDVRQVARDLDVALVLEGSVRSAGDRIRATAQLVDGASGYQLFSKSYDREFIDLFKLQDDLATSIVQAIGDHLRMELPAIVESTPPTRDLQAYDLYLQARSLIDRAGRETLQKAGVLLRRAVERDSEFAQAYSELGRVHLYLYLGSLSFDPRELERGEEAVQRALTLQPDLAEARGLAAQFAMHRGDWLGARRAYEAALALNADEALLHSGYAILLYNVGQIHAGLSEVRAADRLAPGRGVTSLQFSMVFATLGLNSEVVRYAEQAINLGVSPDHPAINMLYATTALRRGDYEEASNRVVRALPNEVRDAGATQTVPRVHAALGDATRTSATIEELRALGQRTGESRSSSWMMVMMQMYTMLGALDLAYESGLAGITRLRRMNTVGGGVWVGLWMPEMRPFRRDPRFQSLADALNMTDYWRAYGPPDNCELRDGRLLCR